MKIQSKVSNTNRFSSLRNALLCAASFTAMTAPDAVWAQQNQSTSISSNAANASEVVIVTARKREESLQSTPLSISAFSAITIDNAGLDSVEDLALLTPGFTFTPLFGGGAATPVIRGQSTTIGEPNVGFFLDGVYQSSRALMDSILGDDIARVEVVKGPQSALYGRNTFGGAVNIVSRPPTNTFIGRATLEAGSFGYVGFRANANVPLIEDKLSARIGFNIKASDGFFINSLTNTELDKRGTAVLSGSLEARPSENLSLRLRISREATEDGDEAVVFTPNNSFPANIAGGTFPNANQMFTGLLAAPTSFSVTPGHNDRALTARSLTGEYDFGWATLTAITGYNSLILDTAVDSDYSAALARYTTTLSDLTELSQELRLTSPSDKRISWMLGAYAFKLESDTALADLRDTDAHAIAAISAVPNGVRRQLLGGVITRLLETTENTAFFAQVGFKITPKLSLNLEGRVNRETKTVNAADTSQLTGAATGTYVNKRTFEKFLPRVTVDYALSDSILLYAAASEGYKAGGFNVATAAGAIADSERTYDPENAWNYEIGAKTSWYDGKLTANLAIYRIDWRNQIVRALGATFATLNTNAGETTVQGVEFEMRARPIRGLDISAGLAYTDSSYDKYTFGTLALVGIPAVLDGTRLQYVSKWQKNISVQYTMPIGNELSWFNRIDYAYRSDQSAVQPAYAVIPEATIVNFRSGLEYKNLSFRVFVDNLTDEDAPTASAYTPSAAQHLAWARGALGMGPSVGLEAFGGATVARAPRTAGVSLSVKF
ncbi:MAG: TonB-dependent receptor [Hyphomonadaceae bacterium]|nr:MAG: TonB-dependent receptor [Hyphomonadaceae bacterium]KAF0184695.1 MAG: TonB-dependent receptor [Hyphomonadaceae bacterium]